MSYQSRLFQSKWTYEPCDTTADDFNTRVGRVLNRGAYTVDGTGKPVGSAFASRTMGEQAKPVMQATTGSMSKPYSKEVVDLWKHVNPGVMEKYVGMPGSTMSDHFKWLPEQQESLNRIHHFKKTDFSEYNEVAARSMKTLITNKGSA